MSLDVAVKMEDAVTDAVSGAAKNFNDAGVLGSVVVLTIIVAGLIIWYLLRVIRDTKAGERYWQDKFLETVKQQIEENRNITQVVESLAGQRNLMAEMHTSLKILERGASR